MAHANPEFAVACRAYREPPSAHQLPPPATLRDLRERMQQIGRLIAIDYPVYPEEREAYRLWCATVRQQRGLRARQQRLQAALSEPVGGMHGRDPAGMRFVEPIARGTGPRKRFAQT